MTALIKKVYFACSIRGGGDKSLYPSLVKIISQKAALLTEIFVADGLSPEGSNLPNTEIWERDISWIAEADAIIAEVSSPSLGVGYEIAKAEEGNKPILCLFRINGETKLSAMIAGCPNLKIANYANIDEAQTAIEDFLANLDSCS